MTSNEPADDTDSRKSIPDLVTVLLEHQVISPAQAELLRADYEVSGMSLAEIVVARSWANQTTLEKLAPWLKQKPAQQNVVVFDQKNPTFEQNFKTYRHLVEKLLGTSWD